jgi:ankyrin repeat protein
MDLPPPPQGDDPIITQFRPQWGQWELTEDNINRIDPETGQTILHNYCQHIHTTPLAVYRYLIETIGCDVNVNDNCNNIPLHVAFGYFAVNNSCDITVLTYLINQKGINADIKGEYDCNFLHFACENINKLPLDIFKLLIERIGCNVNAQDNNNNTPLHVAFSRFCPTKDGGNITVLTYLLNQNGVNVNIKGDYDYTLLHLACEKINKLPLDIFKLLIETVGCDVNVQGNEQETPLHIAFRDFDQNNGGDITVLAYLIDQKGVNLNNKYKNGYTLLHYACIINLLETWYSAELNTKRDTTLCQIVKAIAERCLELVLDEATF